MSYERAESFIEGAAASATAIESEFDNIADYLGGLFRADRVAANANLEDLADTFKDVPGAEVDLTLQRPSLVLVTAVFQLQGGESSTGSVGTLSVNGVDQGPQAPGPITGTRDGAAQVYCLELGVGIHTLKLRAKTIVDVGTGKCLAANTGFTYLVIPAP